MLLLKGLGPRSGLRVGEREGEGVVGARRPGAQPGEVVKVHGNLVSEGTSKQLSRNCTETASDKFQLFRRRDILDSGRRHLG